MRRRPTQELLDTDAGSPKEVGDSLKDLRWFNRWFGGISTSRSLLECAAKGRSELSVLEVAAGDGFVATEMRKALNQTGVNLQFTLLDRTASHLPRNSSFKKVSGDALALPFGDESFDFVFCSLFAHHL